MSKASMDNQRVKNQITEGLFSLLRKKSFSEITVTDIVREAKVARASYYRNFQNKEEIIEAAMDILRDELMKDIQYDDDEHIFNQENARAGFEKALTSCLIRKADLLTMIMFFLIPIILAAIPTQPSRCAFNVSMRSRPTCRSSLLAGTDFCVRKKGSRIISFTMT